jgi:hypothetical protein
MPDDFDVLSQVQGFTLYGNRERAMEAMRLRPAEGWKFYRRHGHWRGRGRGRGGIRRS